MVENRPDWCISRQRLWGVPITIFYCTACLNEFLTTEMLDHVVSLVRQHGAVVWYEREAKDLLPSGTVCPHCQGTEFRKETNILDVWFDSGVSHAAVLETWPNLRSPSDMYLEGSDQHRGWFHSSLLESVGSRNQAPYRNVLTLDSSSTEKARKCPSPSATSWTPGHHRQTRSGNPPPLGGGRGTTRWTSGFRRDLKRLVEAYRRIRNTSRFISETFTISTAERFGRLRRHGGVGPLGSPSPSGDHAEGRGRIRKLQFHVAFYTLHNFCTVT
jgi:isoleucyl-tRNA synthetase